MSLRAFQENPCGSLKNQPVQSNKQSERTKTRELKCLPLKKGYLLFFFSQNQHRLPCFGLTHQPKRSPRESGKIFVAKLID